MWGTINRLYTLGIGHLGRIMSGRANQTTPPPPNPTPMPPESSEMEALVYNETLYESRLIDQGVERLFRRLPQGKSLDLQTIISSLNAANSACEETEYLTLVASEKYFVPKEIQEKAENANVQDGKENDEDPDFQHVHFFMCSNSKGTIPVSILGKLAHNSNDVPYVEVEDPPKEGDYITREPLSLIYQVTTRYGIQMNHPEFRLHIHRLDGHIVNMLKLQFPKLRVLEIIDHGLETIIEPLCAILEHYSDQLIHLKIATLATQFNENQPEVNLTEAWTRLERTINEHCISLRHLTIYDPLEQGQLMLNLGNLAHLEEFSYSFHAEHFRDIISHLDQFPALKRFGCLCAKNPIMEREDILGGPDLGVISIPDKLTRLIYPDTVYSEGLVQRSSLFCNLDLFSSLNMLSLSQHTGKLCSSEQFQFILSDLSCLPKLNRLRITYHPEMMINWMRDPLDLTAFPVLPQIEFLHLDCSICPHQDILFIGSTFPKLKFLIITGHDIECFFADHMFAYFPDYFCTGAEIAHSEQMRCCEERVLREIRNNKHTHFGSLQKVKLFKNSNAFHLFLEKNMNIVASFIVVNFQKLDKHGNPAIKEYKKHI